MTNNQIIPVKTDPALKADFEWSCELTDTNMSAELRRHMRAFVKKELDKALEDIVLSGETPDPVTGIDYMPHEKDDVRTVKRRTWLMRQFERLHPGVKLMPYHLREDTKDAGRRTARDTSKTLDDRAKGFLDVVRAYFSRSVMSTLDERDPRSYKLHPGFEKFAAHYLAAEEKRADVEAQYREVIALLRDQYPLNEPLRMKPGGSYWQIEERAA